jgi:hypothetical protein
MTTEFTDGAVRFAGAAAAGIATLKPGLEGCALLLDFIRPSDFIIGEFKFAVEHLVRSFGDSAADVGRVHRRRLPLRQGRHGQHRDPEAGVEGLALLHDFIRPADEQIGAFKFAVERLVRSFGDKRRDLHRRLLADAQRFADTAHARGGQCSSRGSRGLQALRGFKPPGEGDLVAFKFGVEGLVRALGESAALMSGEFLDHTSRFSDSAAKGIGLLGPGIDGLVKLASFDATRARATP